MGWVRRAVLGLAAAVTIAPAADAAAKGHLPTSATIGGLFARDYQ